MVNNKRWPFCIGVVVILVVFIFVLFKLNTGENPFKTLKPEEVQKIELLVRPPYSIIEITSAKQIQEIINELNQVVIYEEDNSWKEVDGQYIQYIITMTNGQVKTIGAYDTCIIIEGVGYKSKYAIFENLNKIANSIIENDNRK